MPHLVSTRPWRVPFRRSLSLSQCGASSALAQRWRCCPWNVGTPRRGIRGCVRQGQEPRTQRPGGGAVGGWSGPRTPPCCPGQGVHGDEGCPGRRLGAWPCPPRGRRAAEAPPSLPSPLPWSSPICCRERGRLSWPRSPAPWLREPRPLAHGAVLVDPAAQDWPAARDRRQADSHSREMMGSGQGSPLSRRLRQGGDAGLCRLRQPGAPRVPDPLTRDAGPAGKGPAVACALLLPQARSGAGHRKPGDATAGPCRRALICGRRSQSQVCCT